MQIPLSGSLWFLNGVTILFICATQALALLLYAIFPALSIIISVVSMIGSLGATLSGVTFPVAYMDTPVYIVSFLFPIRHFMEVVQTQLYLNGSFPDVWQSLVILLVFIVLPAFLLPRLKHFLTTHKYESIE
jgi:ABC-2 type transport system permease protein